LNISLRVNSVYLLLLVILVDVRSSCFRHIIMSGSIIRENSTPIGLTRQDSLTSMSAKRSLSSHVDCLSYLDGNSPLKLFTRAKTTITDIFSSIAIYVSESNKYIDGRSIQSSTNIHCPHVLFISRH
jgi:hypothetical protein